MPTSRKKLLLRLRLLFPSSLPKLSCLFSFDFYPRIDTSGLFPLPFCGAMAPGVECLLLGKGVMETVGQSEHLVSIALGPGTVLGALWLCTDSGQQSQEGSITILLVMLYYLLPLPEKVPQCRSSAAQVI